MWHPLSIAAHLAARGQVTLPLRATLAAPSAGGSAATARAGIANRQAVPLSRGQSCGAAATQGQVTQGQVGHCGSNLSAATPQRICIAKHRPRSITAIVRRCAHVAASSASAAASKGAAAAASNTAACSRRSCLALAAAVFKS